MIIDQQPPDAPIDGASQRWHALRAPRPRLLAIAVTAVALVAIIVGIISGTTRSNAGKTTTTRATPSATATMVPRVVYQADWSHGTGGWTLPAQAKIVAGQLLLDGVSLQIPYVPTTRNYALEMDFQIEGATNRGLFGLSARNAAGDRQYVAEMECIPMHQGAWNPATGGCPGAVLVSVRGGTYPSGLFTSDYVVRSGPQTFRLEVTGDTLNFCPVDDCLVPVTSPQPMDASPRLYIEDRAVKLLITRLTVTTL